MIRRQKDLTKNNKNKNEKKNRLGEGGKREDHIKGRSSI
jgi:hypothetical protein